MDDYISGGLIKVLPPEMMPTNKMFWSNSLTFSCLNVNSAQSSWMGSCLRLNPSSSFCSLASVMIPFDKQSCIYSLANLFVSTIPSAPARKAFSFCSCVNISTRQYTCGFSPLTASNVKIENISVCSSSCLRSAVIRTRMACLILAFCKTESNVAFPW